MALRAFVARSFDPADEERIRPIRIFLDSFRKAGFFCEEAEAAEVESVSTKVRRMIDERDVFIGFFTRKHAIYNFSSRLSDALSLACGRLRPQQSTAPPWVLQESGYALGAKKTLILLREEGVEIPGLQGDLEYIPFNASNPAAIFSRLSEMINDLLAKVAGREIRVEVTERQETVEAAPQVAEQRQEENPVSKEEQAASIVEHYFEMRHAAEKRDLPRLRSAWEQGKALIASGQAGKIDALWWECSYLGQRYEAGDASALDELRMIDTENPDRYEASSTMAKLLSAAKEHNEAADLYLKVSRLVERNNRAWYLVSAAKELSELSRFKDGLKAAEESLLTAAGETKADAISVLYQLLKNSGQTYFAFARAEAFLHENPQLRLRFDLGLDYRQHGNKSLALYHFKFLHDRNSEESAALHNLALLYSDCELPISSVSRYRGAIALGETLSSANLGFSYLDAGMVEEAKALIEEAILVESHDTGVERCLAEIPLRAQKEKTSETALLKGAAEERDFLVNMGMALQRPLPNIAGLWKFPFGDLTLTTDGNMVSGIARIKKEEQNPFYLSGLFGTTASGQKIEKIERYILAGPMEGAVCKFSLLVNEEGASLGSILGGEVSRSGFLLFSSEGKSGTYVELKDDKLGRPEKIAKVEG